MAHYHLKAGGVASVMQNTAKALQEQQPYETLEIDIFAAIGDEARSRKAFDAGGARIRILNIPSLAYRHEPYADRASFLAASRRLADEILDRIDLHTCPPAEPYILHFHNISLGKNPTATMAFRNIAETAAERTLPLWLINHVHDFAENQRTPQLEAFYECTGRRDEAFARSFMYPTGPNIVYLTINSPDTGNLAKLGIAENRIHFLPDPVDVTRYERPPLWEESSHRIEELGLPPADYRPLLVNRLAECAAERNQVFDSSLPVLLSPVKVMRRKNTIESLLLLALFKTLGRSYQLLVTLDANSPPDIAYSRKIKQFATSRQMPVLVGFGTDLLSDTAQRRIRNGTVRRFSMGDLLGLCSGIMTTSVVEGFGLAYHEGWLARRPVVGRKIPEIVCDFCAGGMSFDHMYERLAVSLDDLPNLRERLVEAYRQKLRKSAPARERRESLPGGSARAIIEGKLFRAGNEDCVDFADLSADMQIELLDRLVAQPTLAGRMIDRNPPVGATYRLLEQGDADLIERNRSVVRSRYSFSAMAARLENLYALGDSLYREHCECPQPSAEGHMAVIERYRTPEHVRLIF
jgi:glycosyltransferase involved in cell wall biosynthesis